MKKKQKNFLLKNLFTRFFGFDQGIDISDDTAVLYRRNIVIKNIIFMSNMMFSIIFLFVSLNNPNQTGDWLITILLLPLTFGINKLLANLIKQEPQNLTKQQVAMYVATFYMFVSAVLVYVRLIKEPVYETVAYVLMYYALVVISLYQDRKLLSGVFGVILTLVTALHFIFTYNILDKGYSISQFFNAAITEPAFKDIILRTFSFIVFYLVVFTIVSIGSQLQEQRKQELIKRRNVQDDFSEIVSSLFSVVFSTSHALLEQNHARIVSLIALSLADYYNLDENKKHELKDYALVHLRFDEIKTIMKNDNLRSFDELKDKTKLGSKIATRLQLAQKAEDITRAHVEAVANETFKSNMQQIQPQIVSQIILMADLYVAFRSPKPYKRPLQHTVVVTIFENELKDYFEPKLLSRFIKYNLEIKQLYDNY